MTTPRTPRRGIARPTARAAAAGTPSPAASSVIELLTAHMPPGQDLATWRAYWGLR